MVILLNRQMMSAACEFRVLGCEVRVAGQWSAVLTLDSGGWMLDTRCRILEEERWV